MPDISVDKSQDSRAIANYILDVAPSYRIKNLTVMQLLKLVYLAHGWSLAFSDTSLVKQSPQAWQYGPVYPEIYKPLSKYGSSPIGERLTDPNTGFTLAPDGLTEKQKAIIGVVLITYGNLHAFDLSNITHKSDSPWDITMKKEKMYGTIQTDLMKEYFSTLAKERKIITS